MKLVEVASPSETDLVKLANEFKKEYEGPLGQEEWGEKLSVCGSEYGNCSMVSSSFHKWLKKRGISSSLITGEFSLVDKWGADLEKAGEEDNHTAVKVGDTVIDFTAKQFDKKFPIPRIYDVDTFKQEWGDVS